MAVRAGGRFHQEPDALMDQVIPAHSPPPAVGGPRPRAAGPDFVGIGVPKSGTSWLGKCFAQHPQLSLGEKEIAFFTRHFHRGYEWYHRHFEGKAGRLAGEITPTYYITPRQDISRKEFYPSWNPRRALTFWRRLPDAARELAERYPGIKVFLVLRDPADRAWSYYWHWRKRKDKLEKAVPTFERMFADDGRWIRSCGYYAPRLRHWLGIFPDMKVLIHDDLKVDEAGLLRSVYEWLGVDASIPPPHRGATNPGKYERLAPELRRKLVDEYRPHVEELEELLGRDLSAWKRV